MLARLGLCIYFGYGLRHSILGKNLRHSIILMERSAVADQPIADAAEFQQRLGLFDATMLVAGTMIGSGIFIVSADIVRDVGTAGWLLLVWALPGSYR